MSQKLVECVANFSEGRRPEVIAAIAESISGVNDIHLLDQHTDPDHNRTVITFAGPPRAVVDAAFSAVAKASQLINMNQHEGEHPRLGATDVIPFVPLFGISMEECVALAVELGQRVGEELNIPVYLYEKAATKPERENLANIRRGEFEALKETIASDPEREPDFGPRKLGQAGATVIGARQALIAFNVYLDTDKVETAKQIARKVRFSSGGLPHVKALGLLVEGRAQVSMNLTHFRETPILQVLERIHEEAAELDTVVHHSEVVGLIPQEALFATAASYLQLEGFNNDQVLENRLFAAQFEKGDRSSALLDQLSTGKATPGGGSAAAFAGAMGASLVSMVTRLTIGKKKYASVKQRMRAILEESVSLRSQLELAVVEDARAFEAVMKEYRLPQENDAQKDVRLTTIEAATVIATEIPMQIARAATRVLALAAETAHMGNVNAITDAASAGLIAGSAARSALLNVRINLRSLKANEKTNGWRDEIDQMQTEISRIEQELKSTLSERGHITAGV
ncbi:MAG: glutamate formimidoyltransferase [Chloroflexi bacterium]|nr:glutamate formimidoyltransferase [Chloroflexota bacterium]